MAIFFNFYILDNIVHENFIYDIPKRKNAFPGYKNEKYRK